MGVNIQSKSKQKLLVFTKPVSKEKVASVVNLSTATTPTTHAFPLYDEEGTLIGWVPVYAASTLAT